MKRIIQRVFGKNITNLFLNNLNNKLEPISLIFAHSISRIFCHKSQLYFLNELPVNSS